MKGSETIYVYSGQCRLCEVGHPADARDINGKPLHTGDIVVIFTENYQPDTLTVVVRNDFTSYGNGQHVPQESSEAFVMGIKSVPIEDAGMWKVLKVKDYSDVVPGEHWSAWGFNYRAASLSKEREGSHEAE